MISLERLKRALGIDHSDDDTLLEEIRDRALAFVQTQTHRYFGLEEEATEYARGWGTRNLYLMGIPVVGDDYNPITAVEYAYPGATPTSITEAVDFEVRSAPRSAWLVRWGSTGVWTRDYEYAVTFTRGYVEDALPGDIEQLVLDLVSLRYTLAGQEAMRSETIGGYSYTRFGEGDLDSIEGGRETIDAWRYAVLG